LKGLGRHKNIKEISPEKSEKIAFLKQGLVTNKILVDNMFTSKEF
jgi:hypothetical protein